MAPSVVVAIAAPLAACSCCTVVLIAVVLCLTLVAALTGTRSRGSLPELQWDPVLELDAGDTDSYPGSGQTWYDLSGNGNHFRLPARGAAWDEHGFFDVRDSAGAFGPRSDRLGLAGGDHTVVVVARPRPQGGESTLLNFEAVDHQRMLMVHLPWYDGRCYYDVCGCCDGSQRVQYATSTPDAPRHYVFRCRSSAFPQRHVFENGRAMKDSGNNATAAHLNWGGESILWNHGSGRHWPWTGDFYFLAVYNRALSDAEVADSAAWARERFGSTEGGAAQPS